MDTDRRAALLGLPLMALGASATAATPVARPRSGRLERLESVPSRFVTPRHVDVWLPPGYAPDRPHAVVYMHDGQMLFDAATTWNGQAWRVDVALDRLRREGRIPDTLVVGIWNHAPLRYAEYFPQKALALADEASRRRYVERAQDGRPLADAYLRFIVEELKPAIDRRYATRPGPETTLVAGSSMGGLISLYALAEYPGVFGGAAALSAHWVGHPTAWGLPQVRNAALPMALLRYFAGTLPAPGRHRLYIDRGDDALDRLYAPALGLAEDLLYERGYTAADAMVRVFEGTGHNESDWAARVDQPLAFLLAGR